MIHWDDLVHYSKVAPTIFWMMHRKYGQSPLYEQSFKIAYTKLFTEEYYIETFLYKLERPKNV